jgi:hypothetical protein
MNEQIKKLVDGIKEILDISEMTFLPCPFCGGGETQIYEDRMESVMGIKGDLVAVEIHHWCDHDLSTDSPRSATKIKAHDHKGAEMAWNRRA